MRVRRPWLVVVMLLVPAVAGAHGHKADFYAAASRTTGSSLWGPQTTLSITSPIPTSLDMSILGDFSAHVGEENSVDMTRLAFMIGTRWTASIRGNDKHLGYGQVLGGGVHDHVGGTDATHRALAFGAGYEFDPEGEDSAFAVRFQIEYVKVFGGGEDFPRTSVGIVYRVRRNP